MIFHFKADHLYPPEPHNLMNCLIPHTKLVDVDDTVRLLPSEMPEGICFCLKE